MVERLRCIIIDDQQPTPSQEDCNPHIPHSGIVFRGKALNFDICGNVSFGPRLLLHFNQASQIPHGSSDQVGKTGNTGSSGICSRLSFRRYASGALELNVETFLYKKIVVARVGKDGRNEARSQFFGLTEMTLTWYVKFSELE
ncbi:uncharacterized protein PHALS_09268 [Plasmopara halstedii]|uniref:Uncharacterized protein n=1 Tax=Plasmopara halstedii TaxID=4781 RepID=A0A0P1AEN2_PLAHL|nr:uncharacterized protein PHALS_09268 [Plasmopara halstedii]CEG39214.1 hypothetical protein PHALS_09268 [Plasmopara halstedii]|eukprot:XP_024575583.1 hypothetical protein PHALS_09268 [Plasmopara halstedii]